MVLPEDDANRQIANGFHLQIDLALQRRMQVLPVAGGWNDVLDQFRSEHISELTRHPNRIMVLLIDCDGDADRRRVAKTSIPPTLTERVFILGVLTEPEQLKPDLGSYERSVLHSQAIAATEQTRPGAITCCSTMRPKLTVYGLRCSQSYSLLFEETLSSHPKNGLQGLRSRSALLLFISASCEHRSGHT